MEFKSEQMLIVSALKASWILYKRCEQYSLLVWDYWKSLKLISVIVLAVRKWLGETNKQRIEDILWLLFLMFK